MEFALIALRQTAVMFLLMGIGWALYRGGKVSRDGSKDLANLLLYVILPCAILHAFCTEYTAEKSRPCTRGRGCGGCCWRCWSPA